MSVSIEKLTTKLNFRPHQKTLTRYFSEAKNNDDSYKRGFSQQYLTLIKRLKFKTIKTSVRNMSNDSLSQNSFRLRTESESVKKNNFKVHSREETQFSLYPIHNIDTVKNFTNMNSKVKRKILKKSRYSVFNEDIGLLTNLKYIKNNEQNLKINQNQIIIIDGVLSNIQRLMQIRKAIEKYKKKDRYIVQNIKVYIMEKHKSWEQLFLQKEDQNQFKEFISVEKCFIIAVVDLIARDQLYKLVEECLNFFDSIFGFYKYLVKTINNFNKSSQISAKIKILSQFFKESNIEEKTSLTSATLFLSTKIHNIFRCNLPFYHASIKRILKQSCSLSINRTFYNLLTQYALQLNNNDIFLLNKPVLSTFATCPSPYILKPRKDRRYTLFVDLDETLIHSHAKQGKYKIMYRPYSVQFVNNLSFHYEIIIFTSSMSVYAEQVASKFTNISHILCRQHTIRLKGDYIKDLSRTGRSLQTSLIVDNLPQNFKLNKQNGILIEGWMGNAQDQVLVNLQNKLISIAKDKPSDIRIKLKQYQGRSSPE